MTACPVVVAPRSFWLGEDAGRRALRWSSRAGASSPFSSWRRIPMGKRRAVLVPVRVTADEVERERTRQVSRLGNSLNQIARWDSRSRTTGIGRGERAEPSCRTRRRHAAR